MDNNELVEKLEKLEKMELSENDYIIASVDGSESYSFDEMKTIKEQLSKNFDCGVLLKSTQLKLENIPKKRLKELIDNKK